MVILRNLKIKDKLIYFDYFPEDENDPGHVVYDPYKEKVISHVLSSYEKDFSGTSPYFYYAVRKLERVLDSSEYKEKGFSDEYTAYWC